MYNLKGCKGTFKGIIGECMFKLTRNWAVLPLFFKFSKYRERFYKYYSVDQIDFLRKYWHSIDAIEIKFLFGKPIPYLYEIKTKNSYRKHIGFKPKMTMSTEEVYSDAKKLGFVGKIAIVYFQDNWKFEVNIKDFDKKFYCLDKPKLYDRK